MAAAASKYTSTAPSWLRNESGNKPGATVATTLYPHVTPVPIAISVNMFSFIVRAAAPPRTKNGHPAHNTTGVASTSCSQAPSRSGTAASTAWNMCDPITDTKSGAVSTTETSATDLRRIDVDPLL